MIYKATHYCCVPCYAAEMDDFEQESINEELIEFAIQESIQDAHKAPCSTHSNRFEPV